MAALDNIYTATPVVRGERSTIQGSRAPFPRDMAAWASCLGRRFFLLGVREGAVTASSAVRRGADGNAALPASSLTSSTERSNA